MRFNFDDAQHWFTTALDIWSELKNLREIAATLQDLASIAIAKRQYKWAHQLYNQAYKICIDLGLEKDAEKIIYCKENIATNWREVAEKEQRELENQKDISAETLLALTDNAIQEDNLTLAEKLVEKAQVKARTEKDFKNAATGLLVQGRIYYYQNRLSEAEKVFTQALTEFERLESESGQAHSFHHLARILEHKNEDEEALNMLAKAMEIFLHIQDYPNLADSLAQSGVILRKQGKYREAVHVFLKAFGIASHYGLPEAGNIKADLAFTMKQMGETEFCNAWYEETEEIVPPSLIEQFHNYLQHVNNQEEKQ